MTIRPPSVITSSIRPSSVIMTIMFPLNRPSSPVLMTPLLLILHGSGCQSLVDAGDHGRGSSGGRILDMLFPDVITQSGLVSEDAGDHGGGSSGGRISDMLFPDVVTQSGLVSEDLR